MIARNALVISLLLLFTGVIFSGIRVVVMDIDVYMLPGSSNETVEMTPGNIKMFSEVYSEIIRSRLQALGVDVVWDFEIETMCGTALADMKFKELLECCRGNGVDKIINGFLGTIEDTAMLVIRIFDVRTGRLEFVLFSDLDYGEDFVEKIRKFILAPNEGRVISIDDDTVYTTLSKYSGLKVGDKLSVYREELVDFDSGMVVYENRTKIGIVEITDVTERGSVGKIIEGGDEIEEMDLVVLEKNK